MKELNEFHSNIDIVFTDIDDTLTDEGRLGPEAYQALWRLHQNNIQIIPVTGRPAGWCEMIARQWPVTAVIGENGGFYFRYLSGEKKMKRHFTYTEQTRKENRDKLHLIEKQVLSKVPRAAVASDQFCRMMDLAIDYCEDIPPLTEKEIETILQVFAEAGATAKLSSIHINGWFGSYDKVSMVKKFLNKEFIITESEAKERCAFVGDSPNDEPMFEFLPHSFGVANVADFAEKMKSLPKYKSPSRGGQGFAEIADQIIKSKETAPQA